MQCLYFVEQGLIGGGLLVTGSICEIELVEQSFRTGYLAVLDSAQVERFQASLGLGHEEQVLETTVIAESHGPVGGIVAYRSRNLESTRQFRVHRDLRRAVEVPGEIAFCFAVGEHPVLHALGRLISLGLITIVAARSEDARIVFAFDPVVADMVNDHVRFLLDDQTADPRDELLRIVTEHEELVRADALEDVRGAPARNGRGLCDLSEQVVFHAVRSVDVQVAGMGVVPVEVCAVCELVA